MSKWEEFIPRPRSNFLRVKCLECGNEQTIFSNTSNTVQCNVCEAVIAEPTGGKSKIHGEILEVM